MKIGLFTDSYFPRKDGVTYTVDSWRDRLEERGHEVFVFYPKVEGYEPGCNEFPVFSLPDPWYEGHRWPFPIGKLLPGSEVPELDIVHCHSPGGIGFFGRYYAWRNNIPAVFSFHTPLEEYAEGLFGDNFFTDLLRKLYIYLDQKFLSTFDVITSNTGEIRNRELDVLELPVGIDCEFFQHREDDFIDDMGLDRPVAGYSGRLSEEKNIGNILEMAENFEGTVLIVGNGRHESALKDKAGNNVVFRDFLPREDLPRLYSGIDVLIHASTGDTFSLTSLEANACGTPVVAPNVHPFDKVIEEMKANRE